MASVIERLAKEQNRSSYPYTAMDTMAFSVRKRNCGPWGFDIYGVCDKWDNCRIYLVDIGIRF